MDFSLPRLALSRYFSTFGIPSRNSCNCKKLSEKEFQYNHPIVNGIFAASPDRAGENVKKYYAANSGETKNGRGLRIAGERGYFTRTTKFTVKPVPAGMVPVVVQRTFVTQKSYPAGAAHPPLTGKYVQNAPLSLE